MTEPIKDFSGPVSLEQLPDALQSGPLPVPGCGTPEEWRRSYAEDAETEKTVAVVPDGTRALTRPHPDRRTIMFEMIRRYNQHSALIEALECRRRQVKKVRQKLGEMSVKVGRFRGALREIWLTLDDAMPASEKANKIRSLCDQVLPNGQAQGDK